MQKFLISKQFFPKSNNDDTTFRIFRCVLLDGDIKTIGNEFSLKGDLAYLSVGCEYEMELRYEEENKFGITYSAVGFPKYKMESLDYTQQRNLLLSITSENITNEIMEVFPDFVNHIIDNKPLEDIPKISGVGDVRLHQLQSNILSKLRMFDYMEVLKDWHLDFKTVFQFASLFENKQSMMDTLMHNPYDLLINTGGYSFAKADEIILRVHPKFAKSFQRTESALVATLKNPVQYEGNTRENPNYLLKYLPSECLENVVDVVKSEESCVYYDEQRKQVSLYSTWKQERNIADFLINSLQHQNKWNIDCSKYKHVDGFEMTEEQTNVLKQLCDNNIVILNAQAGTGKTSSLKGVLRMCDDNGYSYTLLAPTGKVSKRIEEVTGEEASTIHRKCVHDIDTDLIVVEEFSMVSVSVFGMLINAITNPYCKLLLIGDLRQIAPIEYGSPMRDMVNSNVIPVCTLTQVFRFNEGGLSYVTALSAKGEYYLNDTDEPQVFGKNKDYLFLPSDNTVEQIEEAYSQLLAKGVNTNEITIITPWNVGDFGAITINNHIQKIVNAGLKSKHYLEKKVKNRGGMTTCRFYEGDFVLNTTNNYQAKLAKYYSFDMDDNNYKTTVFNGEIGVVTKVNDDVMFVAFDGDREVVYTKSQLVDLTLGYCVNTYREQGSENKYIIIITKKEHRISLNKNMIYTQLSRGKVKVIEIGDKEVIKSQVSVDGIKHRNTWLKDMLVEGLGNI